MAFPAKKQNPAKEGELVRRFKANPFLFTGTVVILVIVIVAFVFVPAIVPEAGGALTDLTFGTYNKTPITYVQGNYFARVQEQYAQLYQSSMNDNNYLSMLRQIWRGAFEETVVHTGILDEVQRAGYTPSEELVDKETAQNPAFWGDDGRFSATRYRAYDNAARIAIWRTVRDSIIEQQYRSDISGLLRSSKEEEFFASMASPERRFDMAAFPLSMYPDSEVRAYAAANTDTFRITHLYKITINSSEQEGKRVLDSVKEGTLSFEDAASAHSKDAYAEKGGDMGIKMAYELVSEVPDQAERTAAAALPAGEYSPLVKVSSGWAFFRAAEASYPADTSDADTLAKIWRYMEGFERGRIEDWIIARAEEFAAQVRSASFDEAVEAQGLTKQSFGPLPMNYGGTYLFTPLDSFGVAELNYAGTNDNFWRTAFFTPVGSPSKPFVIGSSVLVLYPLEETQALPEKTESVKAQFSSYWLINNTESSLRSFFIRSPKLTDRFDVTFFDLFLPKS